LTGPIFSKHLIISANQTGAGGGTKKSKTKKKTNIFARTNGPDNPQSIMCAHVYTIYRLHVEKDPPLGSFFSLLLLCFIGYFVL
jgi:hypothetical protein